MFKNFGIGRKIGLGYALVTSILVVAVLTTIWQVNKTTEVTNRIIELRTPTAQSSLMVLNGINHSLAALRGWIILGKDKFKTERGVAWSDEIESAMDNIGQLSANWTNPQNIQRLKIIKTKLVDFKKYQKEIEDIAQTIENTPAKKILFQEAAPQAGILVKNITIMIDLELQQEATAERKNLLGIMADVRGTTGLALANIRAYLLSGDQKFKEKFDKLWAKNITRFDDLTNSVELLTAEQLTAFEAFANAREIFAPLPAKMFEIRGNDDWNLANTWLGTKAAPTAFAIKVALGEMLENQQELMAADMAEGKRLTTLLATIEWVLLVGGVVISTFLGIFMTRSITKPINRIIADLNEGADQVASASGQVSSASQSLAEGSTEQAAGLEETSSSLEEMTSMTNQNAENAQQASTLAAEARTSAEKGNEAMGRMSTAISEIQRSSEETAKIIKVIDEIAFQTNLLALNAAVEAARAGEAGKGFAVVAEEVRNLAMRSADAAKNTSEMIEASVKNAQNGVDITNEVGKGLAEIVVGIGKTTDLVGEIAAASQEQAQGIEQVNTAITQMDKVTQQNAANAEESASAAEELNAQAQQMNSAVGELIALVGGSAAQAATAAKSSASSRANLSTSDRTYHHIAGGTSKQTGTPVAQTAAKSTASKAIPLDDDHGDANFEDFNS